MLKEGLSRKALLLPAIALAIWITVIVSSGAGWNPLGVEWNFSNTGGFGDSFGPISAFMASVAALSAIMAYNSQRAESTRLIEREEKEDARRAAEDKERRHREEERDKAARISAFEGTFFNLLESFTQISSRVDIITAKGVDKTAHDAFQSILKYADYVGPRFKYDLEKVWRETISKYRNDLNHYFRFMYHIVVYVDSSSIENKYFYVRLVRSMLSESEIILLGLNCEYGDGSDRFRPLVEKYSMLHNISPTGRAKWFKDTDLGDAAFSRPQT